MKNLKDNNLKQLTKGDFNQVLRSIEKLPQQLIAGFASFKTIRLPKNYYNISNIIVCGMGGSTLGADLVRHLFADYLQVPMIINNQYQLPKFADKNSLIVLSSYSGQTEETLNCLRAAINRHLKIFIITSGGQLAKIAWQKKLPNIIFNPLNNPSAQPRLGLGYSLGIFWQLLKKLNLLKLKNSSEKEFISAATAAVKDYGINKPQNQAIGMAKKIRDKIPIFVAAEFLAGNGHIIANQLNESAKIFANYFLIPELNHHLLEGLNSPLAVRKNLIFIFINSDLYQPRNQLRFQLTGQILKKLKITYLNFQPAGKTILAQSANALVFGSYLSLYLAWLNQVNPLKTPWVNFFKNGLK